MQDIKRRLHLCCAKITRLQFDKMSAQTEEILEPQLSEDAQSTVKDGASIVLEAEGSRPNTAESKSDSCSTATSESREPAQKPDSQPDRDAHDASGSSEFSDQENELARSSGDDVLLEEERGSISDSMDAEADLHSLDDDDSCSEGSLECISRDVGLGENPFASPSISRVVAADDHRTATASPVNHDPYSPDFTPRRSAGQTPRILVTLSYLGSSPPSNVQDSVSHSVSADSQVLP